MVLIRSLLAIAASVAAATAQTFTPCQPLEKDCPPDAALGTSWNTTFGPSMAVFDPNMWTVEDGDKRISFSKAGADLAIQSTNQSVTIKSNFYIMFGVFEIVFRAAPGQGIISTGILLSDDLDEIDWEIIGSNNTHVSNNWYGHGNTSQLNGDYPPLAGAATDFHNYTVDWNKDRVLYMLDGRVVRTVNADVSGKYPQTPCFIRFGLWPAGDSAQQGTVDWAGGRPDYKQGPFVMTVKSVRVVDGQQNTTEYSYSDRSGSASSIKSVSGQSMAYKFINKLSTGQQAIKGWNDLSTGAKIGIAAGVSGVVAIGMLAFCIWCCLQRKRGREEKRVADKEWEEQQGELLAYRRMQAKGGFAVSSTQYQQPKSHMSFGDSDRSSNRF